MRFTQFLRKGIELGQMVSDGSKCDDINVKPFTSNISPNHSHRISQNPFKGI